LLANGDEASVRYACLELRFGIEYVTYDQLLTYLAEVPDDTVKKWTPKQIIDSLLEVDPNADQSVAVAVGLEETAGIPAAQVESLGQERRFSLKWANTNHNALGNFLHAPTIEQLEAGRSLALTTMVKKAEEVVAMLEAILTSPVFRVNFGVFYDFVCEDCGTKIKRRSGGFKPEQGIVCPKRDCQAAYDVVSEDGPEVRLSLRRSRFNCPSCKATNSVGTHRVQDGAVVACAGCGAEARIERRFHLVPLKRDG
jgi:hypothetical protein